MQEPACVTVRVASVGLTVKVSLLYRVYRVSIDPIMPIICT